MGQKEHKAHSKLCPIDHNTTMHCPIPLQIKSPLKGCFISRVSFPICQYMKLKIATTHLKLIWSRQLKLYPPHMYSPVSGLLLMEKNNFKKIPPLDKVPLLRRKQRYCLNNVISFPSTHIILCQEAQLLYMHLRSFSPASFTTPLFPYSPPPSPSTGFALIFLAFVHLHCFTPPHLLNLLLK